MPFIEDKDEQLLERQVLGLPEFEEATQTTRDIAMATFRTENSIGSLISREKGLPDVFIDNVDYNPWDNLTDEEKLDESFLENAMLADSDDELEAVRRQTVKERKDRKIMSEGGAMSFAMGFGIGGVGDPINLVPVGGTIYKTYKTGSSILKAGMVTGSVAAGSTAAQEAALHATQIERTYEESAINMGASFLLGGTLGASVEGLKGMGVKPETIDQINDSMNVEPKIREGADSVGAARVMEDVEVKGKFSSKLVKAFGFDPLSRTITSENPATRRVANFLAENPIEMDGGITQAVESMAKIHDGKYAKALEGHLTEYRSYKKAGNRLGKKDFNELVAREIRNPNPDAPIQVKQAADRWNKELYEPLKEQMIKNELLPEDVDVTTAKNYLNRVWNKQKLAAQLPEFINRTSRWLEEQDVKLFAKAKAAADELKTATGARKTELEEIVKKAEFKKGLDLEKQDYEDVARQISQRIRGTPDGRLPYDWKLGDGSSGFNTAGTKLRGPLRNRTFNIPDNLVDDFLENDIEVLGARYLRQTAADIELSKAFDGDVEMKNALKEVDDWWSDRIAKEKDPKKRVKLEKQKDRDINDISSMRDRIRGTFGQVDHNNPWVRTGRVVRDLNYLRFMGGVVASSVPDVARIFMAEGFAKTFKNGLKPLVSNMKKFKVASAEAKRYGVGTDALMGGRSEIIADVADYTQGGTAIERLTRGAAEKFGRVNMMDFWTAGVKQLHAVTMQTSIFDDLAKGKIDKRLKRLGISDADAKAMLEQVKKHGKKEDGVWLTGAKNWDSPELEEMWGAAMRKESDRVIVVPGQEKPLFMSTELGKTFFQFRSFMFSSTQRMLMAGIQGQDHNYIGGTLMITSLGMMAYAFKQWDAGREISDDPRVWVSEGIDRSGSLGAIMEINNTLEKISNNNFGLRPLIGASAPASRFASRSQLEGFLGPTLGSFAETTLKVLSAGTQDREWDEKDTRALRRLIPYQNLSVIRQGFDKLEEELAK